MESVFHADGGEGICLHWPACKLLHFQPINNGVEANQTEVCLTGLQHMLTANPIGKVKHRICWQYLISQAKRRRRRKFAVGLGIVRSIYALLLLLLIDDDDDDDDDDDGWMYL